MHDATAFFSPVTKTLSEIKSNCGYFILATLRHGGEANYLADKRNLNISSRPCDTAESST